MKKLDIAAAALLIVGGLNWGLVAIAEFDLVAALVGLEFGETNQSAGLSTASSAPPPFTRSHSSTPSDGAGAATHGSPPPERT